MTFPDRLKLPFAFGVDGLVRDLDSLSSDEWIAHFVRQNYEGDWSVLPLRGVAGATHPVKMIYPDPSATEFEDTPFLARCPNIAEALAQFRCPLQAVRLMRLTSGSVIKEHCDHDLDVESGTVRFHVPIVTNPGVTFEINRAPVRMAAGEVWYLRLSDPHRVSNAGADDRVHLVIDASVNDWLLEQFAQAQTSGTSAVS